MSETQLNILQALFMGDWLDVSKHGVELARAGERVHRRIFDAMLNHGRLDCDCDGAENQRYVISRGGERELAVASGWA